MSSAITKSTFPVLEMTCAVCAGSVESRLRSLPGVQRAEVNYASAEALVEYDGQQISPEVMQQAITEIGYGLVIPTASEAPVVEATSKWRRRAIGSIGLSIPVVILGMGFMSWSYTPILSWLLATPVVLGYGFPFFRVAWRQAGHRLATMDTLVALSTGTAYLYSTFNTFSSLQTIFSGNHGPHLPIYFEAAAVVIAFVSLGKWLEERARHATGAAMEQLMQRQPTQAVVVEGDREELRPVTSIQTGDILRARAGDQMAVDGEVLEGYSTVDESMITGEFLPAEKNPGSHVFAGTVNLSGTFTYRAAEVGATTVLARMISRVREAQNSKAPVQKLADQVAAIFVPTILGIALLTFILWIVFGGWGLWSQGLIAAITVLVIACPCALGLATPTALMAGLGKGAQHQILIRDAESLEQVHRITDVVLDKTGTLTKGTPVVVASHWPSEHPDPEQQQILYALESRSTHPVATAVRNSLGSGDASQLSIHNFTTFPGQGVTAEVRGSLYLSGKPEWLMAQGIEFGEAQALLQQWQQTGYSLSAFARAEKLLALFAVDDTLTEGAKEAVAQLQAKGLQVHLLTGDHESAARRIAAQVGITHVKWGVLPSEKSAYLRDLQHQGKIVAMVGDGINDTEALAVADVSIAMGSGADIAVETARITLMGRDLRKLPQAFYLSTRLRTTIRQNLFWAFIYNLIGVPLAAGILYPVNGFLLDPMIAGAAMAMSSLSVVANSLRLTMLKWK